MAGVELAGLLTIRKGRAKLAVRLQRCHARIKMNGPRNSYRDYYYYGPLSTGRDGPAKGCREVSN